MALNRIWIFLFLSAFLVALFRLVLFGDTEVFTEMVNASFDMAKTGFEISLGLTGVLTLWLGLMRVGEKGGVVDLFSRAVGPFFARLFPDLPKDHKAYGPMLLNFSANMLGLDNAATPLGLKAMEEMQKTNPVKDTASNPMIMFLVLNTSGLTILPVSIMVYRAQLGAANPSDIFLPILLATFFSTMAGLLAVAWFQKINLLDKVLLAYLGGMTLFVAAVIYTFSQMSQDRITEISSLVANLVLFTVIVLFITLAAVKKVNVFNEFIEGAKEGFPVAVKIIPYLVAILVAIGAFRASGALDLLTDGFRWVFSALSVDTRFIEALPTALMKPLSGSGARGMMVDVMHTYGADSFVGRVASTVQGATDTTFYIVALYFGSVGIRNTRYAITAGLIADFAGIVAAILMAYLFFGG